MKTQNKTKEELVWWALLEELTVGDYYYFYGERISQKLYHVLETLINSKLDKFKKTKKEDKEGYVKNEFAKHDLERQWAQIQNNVLVV